MWIIFMIELMGMYQNGDYPENKYCFLKVNLLLLGWYFRGTEGDHYRRHEVGHVMVVLRAGVRVEW